MKLKLIVILGILFLVSQVSAEEKLVLKNQKEKVSYIIGTNIGSNLKRQLIDIDPTILVKGIHPLAHVHPERRFLAGFKHAISVAFSFRDSS